jgi:hypothetical protein
MILNPGTRIAIALAAVAAAAFGDELSTANQRSPVSPRVVTVCELSRTPDAWNHVVVRVTGTATREFESFALADAACDETKDSTSIWLTYGGRVSPGSIYCCPGEGDRSPRPQPLVLEGLKLPLVEDAMFRRFRTLMNREPRGGARVTLIGRFFAGDASQPMRGFGHFGCCSLLVIERVTHVREMIPRRER